MADENVQEVHAGFEPVDVETGEYLVREEDEVAGHADALTPA